MIKSPLFILFCFTGVLISYTAHACDEIFVLRDHTKIYTESHTGVCLKNAYKKATKEPLKDGLYYTIDGESGVVHDGCWGILEQKKAQTSDGRVIYTVTLTDAGNNAYYNENEKFIPFSNGEYQIKDQDVSFSVTDGMINEYGYFDKEGRFWLEDRN